MEKLCLIFSYYPPRCPFLLVFYFPFWLPFDWIWKSSLRTMFVFDHSRQPELEWWVRGADKSTHPAASCDLQLLRPDLSPSHIELAFNLHIISIYSTYCRQPELEWWVRGPDKSTLAATSCDLQLLRPDLSAVMARHHDASRLDWRGWRRRGSCESFASHLHRN